MEATAHCNGCPVSVDVVFHACLNLTPTIVFLYRNGLQSSKVECQNVPIGKKVQKTHPCQLLSCCCCVDMQGMFSFAAGHIYCASHGN